MDVNRTKMSYFTMYVNKKSTNRTTCDFVIINIYIFKQCMIILLVTQEFYTIK